LFRPTTDIIRFTVATLLVTIICFPVKGQMPNAAPAKRLRYEDEEPENDKVSSTTLVAD